MADPTPRDPREVLGLRAGFTAEELASAWRAAARRTHPDRGGVREDFEEARAAFEILSDPDLRGGVDRGEISLEDAWRGAAARIEQVLPEAEQLLEEVAEFRAARGLKKIAAGARSVQHALSLIDRFRRG